MEYAVTRRGAALIGLWGAAAGLAVSLPFWHWAPFLTLMLVLLWFLLCFGVLASRLCSLRVRVGGHHLTVRVGLLFLSTKRIPLRFITGCHIWQTPLQRATGTCVLLLLASGTCALVPGLGRQDAELLAAKLSHGGKLL